jgi:ribonuclease E
MAKRMLIDAAHPEETRVVVTSGHRLEEFDFESSTKKQVKGNIYLAKVTRVEPSLQAAFVDYGGNRHGFLAFSEIHPDYYRIPVSDRPAGEADPPAENGHRPANGADSAVPLPLAVAAEDATASDEPAGDTALPPEEPKPSVAATPEPPLDALAAVTAPPIPPDQPSDAPLSHDAEEMVASVPDDSHFVTFDDAPPFGAEIVVAPDANAMQAVENAEWAEAARAELTDEFMPQLDAIALRAAEESMLAAEIGEPVDSRHYRVSEDDGGGEAESVETLGGDEVEEVEEADAERRRSHSTRHYKIQEVIKRRQIMLVQVAKEERGNKGAALTTYLSLAGRYCVLMPNTGRGGGVSRKINSLTDRRRLKEILEELDLPEGMGVIVRTAGAERSKAEIKRDYEYLLRLWNEIRDLTLKSTAPALIYEEGNLIKRSIRDLYTRDIDEVLVEGEEGYKTAKAFMRTLMPSHAKRVQPYRDPQVGLFHRFQIESQIDAVHSPVAQLRSGGYVVINQTEALVAIDVNSGRSTRERNIEETAVRTNLEAAEEIARQLRLRDLAGLIVIDFIDMEEHRNQVAVERRMKEALKNDRARIQVGRISPFGLLEMSRQRLRPSLAEASTQPCPHCGGTGFIRSVESTALYVLRSIEEEGSRRRAAEICLYVPTNVALYILNQKRESLSQIEARYGVRVTVARDDSLIPPSFRLERLRAFEAGEAPLLRAIQAPTLAEDDEEDEVEEVLEVAEPTAAVPAEPDGEEDRAHRRRRRRRRRPDEPREARPAPAALAADEPSRMAGSDDAASKPPEEEEAEREAEAERRRRRRGRRGGRARPRREEAAETASDLPVAAETIEIAAAEEADSDREAVMMPAPVPWPEDAGIDGVSLAPRPDEAEEAALSLYELPPLAEAEPVPSAISPAPAGETAADIAFVGEVEVERVLETTAAQAPATLNGSPPSPPPGPDEAVLAVNEKPANPRRGWWQRLIQS